MRAKITIAKDFYGIIKHISEVENGLQCNCSCIDCCQPLIAANKGKIQEFHFRHKTESICGGSPETGLHLLAKRIISESKIIRIDKTICFDYDKSIVEGSIYDIRPDIQISNAIGEKWLIEVAVSHFIEQTKLDKIRSNKLNCLEINLQGVDRQISFKELKRVLLDDLDIRKVISRETSLQPNLKASNGNNSWLWILGGIIVFFWGKNKKR